MISTYVEFELGVAAHHKGDLATAKLHYRAELMLNPEHVPACHFLGVIDAIEGRIETALARFNQVLGKEPNNELALLNRGSTYLKGEQYQLARSDFERALELDPHFFEACQKLAYLLQQTNHHESATEYLRTAVSLCPSNTEVQFDLGLHLLILGRYEEGWRLYEHRRHTAGYRKSVRHFTQPVLTHLSEVKGKTVLLHKEQGIGDTLQFCRYAKVISDHGAKVILEVQPELQSLLGAMDGVIQVCTPEDELPPFDARIALMSLPLLCGTQLANIPFADGYLTVDSHKVNVWSSRLSQLGLAKKGKPRAGFVWRGNPNHPNNSRRSLSLNDLLPLFQPFWHSVILQKDITSEERLSLEALPLDARPTVLSESLDNWQDTAAVLTHLDILITVDTSVAHLAGALQCRAWVLLAEAPDWRWLLSRADSPWYSSIRLFRKEALQSWLNVVSKVELALQQEIGISL